MNLNISIVPVCASMTFLPVVDNIQIEGTVSQIFDIGPRYLMRIASKNFKYFGHIVTEIFTLKK